MSRHDHTPRERPHGRRTTALTAAELDEMTDWPPTFESWLAPRDSMHACPSIDAGMS